MNYPSWDIFGDTYFIEVRLMKISLNSRKPEIIGDFTSNEDKLGFVQRKFDEVTEKLSREII